MKVFRPFCYVAFFALAQAGELGQWSTWSGCTVTCGQGSIQRARQCIGGGGCSGALTEVDGCFVDRICPTGTPSTAQPTPPPVPVNGGWTYWSEWQACSRSCGKGSQRRVRHCGMPEPQFGGATCPGRNSETQACNDIPCPDCQKQCWLGSLKSTCEYCLCPDSVIYGTVTDTNNRPLSDARVYLKSSLAKPIATTDEWGQYTVTGVCLLGEDVYLEKAGYHNNTVNIIQGNLTHGEATGTLSAMVPPMIVEQPSDKDRFVGQRVTLCCSATGDPTPTKFTWYKDGVEVNYPRPTTTGSLVFNSIQKSDEGEYYCIAESSAGLIRSSAATIKVHATGSNTCGSPQPSIQSLPSGCHVSGGNTVDVKTCGDISCVGPSQSDNGTCVDWWQPHCCVSDQTEQVDVQCQGFSYQLHRIRSCKCLECHILTQITGHAYGKKNGTEVPFSYGSVYINGKKIAMANSLGIFTIDVPKGMKRVILNFEDELFKKFTPCTKVFDMPEGVSALIPFALPLKPKPILFNTATGIEIPLAASGLSRGTVITIPDNAVLNTAGQPYTGLVDARVHYMDPRSLDDLNAANGAFVSQAADGSLEPMVTYGMFHLSVEDYSGNALTVNKPIQVILDTSVLNITTDSAGNPDASMWHFDSNRGVWIEMNKLKKWTSAGRRRRSPNLPAGINPLNGVFTTCTVPAIPQIQLNESKVIVTRYRVPYLNCDGGKPYWTTKKVTNTTTVMVPKRDACFVSVTVYDNEAKTKPLKGVHVTAVTQELNGRQYRGQDMKITGDDGHVCLGIFCDEKVILYATDPTQGGNMPPTRHHDLPSNYVFSNLLNSSPQTQFTAKNIGAIQTAGGVVRYSPVYYAQDLDKCKNNHKTDFNFEFAPSAPLPVLHTKVDIREFNNRLSWYTSPPDKPERKACFIKVLVKTNNPKAHVLATSYQFSSYGTGNEYGTYDVVPIPDPGSSDQTTRAACVQYRCTGLVRDGKKIINNVPTDVKVTVQGTNHCQFKRLQNIGATSTGNGFHFVAPANQNRGPAYGVYIADGNAKKVQNICYNGKDTGNLGLKMKPTEHAAVELDCT